MRISYKVERGEGVNCIYLYSLYLSDLARSLLSQQGNALNFDILQQYKYFKNIYIYIFKIKKKRLIIILRILHEKYIFMSDRWIGPRVGPTMNRQLYRLDASVDGLDWSLMSTSSRFS